MIELPESPNFSVRWRLDIKNEGPKSRFYLLDMGSCWNNNGAPCDGDLSHQKRRWLRVGDPRIWELDIGGMSSRLYFYQDPDPPSAKRIWTSIDTRTKIFVSAQVEVA
ncbi:hypothetical protein JHK82_033921 [Glycine max]|nr:hypothetical protein JHK85_034632 [Glycine max]KAG4986310.1 hypothetical protein JHK86_034001 [Glycine max]KAG5119501.1 hypothetical protein JHK82_033921 [Glycine max]KAG5140492.1 hypothetical protein JHK84_034260 [Glycine max]